MRSESGAAPISSSRSTRLIPVASPHWSVMYALVRTVCLQVVQNSSVTPWLPRVSSRCSAYQLHPARRLLDPSICSAGGRGSPLSGRRADRHVRLGPDANDGGSTDGQAPETETTFSLLGTSALVRNHHPITERQEDTKVAAYMHDESRPRSVICSVYVRGTGGRSVKVLSCLFFCVPVPAGPGEGGGGGWCLRGMDQREAFKQGGPMKSNRGGDSKVANEPSACPSTAIHTLPLSPLAIPYDLLLPFSSLVSSLLGQAPLPSACSPPDA